MPDIEGLKELGPIGTFVGMMATAIVALSTAVGVQWKSANKVYGQRIAERDDYRDTLNANTKAVENFVRTSEQRNQITEELAAAVAKLAAVFERLNDRLEMQHDWVKENARDRIRDNDDMIKTVASMADAVRVNTGMVTDVRDHLARNRP